MARNRLPQAKADVSGAAQHNPKRFEGRKALPGSPLGAPYATMTSAQKRIWQECRQTMPWLKASHRILLRQVCVLTARMEDDQELGVSAMQALGSLLSKLGATPVDETKVIYGSEETDPDDGFFAGPPAGRPN